MNILDYINGSKRGKEAHELEQKAMHDPFLAEAIDGYESVKGNHSHIITRLQQKVDQKSKKKRFRQPMFIWSTILALVIVLGIIVIFFMGGFHRHFKKIDVPAVTVDSIPRHDTVTSIPVPSSSEHSQDVRSVQKNENDTLVSKPTNSPKIQSKPITGRKLTSSAAFRQHSQMKDSASVNNFTGNTPAHVVMYQNLPDSNVDRTVAMDVSGIVKDTKGNPLIGAKVAINGANRHVLTDSEGKFVIKNVFLGQTLSFDYIGFKSKEQVLSDKANGFLTINMDEDSDLLSEQQIISTDAWRKSAKPVTEKATPDIGFKAYKAYIEEHKKVSSSPDCKGKRGRVRLMFATDKSGHPYNIRIVRGLCAEYDGQAISLVNNGPVWTPNCLKVKYEISYPD